MTIQDQKLKDKAQVIQDHHPDTDGVVPALPTSTVPLLFTTRLPLSGTDNPTETTQAQESTVNACLPFLTGTKDGLRPSFNSYGVPALERQNHILFVRDTLEKMPAPYVAYDPVRPWLVYWACTALSVLDDLNDDPENRELRNRAMDIFAAQQNSSGGFASSHGFLSHLAPSYAAVLSLAMLSGMKDGVDSLGMIDRKAMWEWLASLKQRDGGFAVCQGGEIDVRGAYCAMTIVSILNLPLELPQGAEARAWGMTRLTDGLTDWLHRCQTYEGGIAGAPNSEAHGAYAFCALACLSLLGDPRIIIPRHLDVPLLIAWLSSRQYAPEGGFSGRTNKLVDACYSHWVGGCWPILETVVYGNQQASSGDQSLPLFKQAPETSFYSREGLIRYILCCCQAEDGGLRDKPGKYPDGYHSCYTLAGLSSAQHYNSYLYPKDDADHSLPAPFGWHSIDVADIGSKDGQITSDIVNPVHPIFVIPFEAVERARGRFSNAAWR